MIVVLAFPRNVESTSRMSSGRKGNFFTSFKGKLVNAMFMFLNVFSEIMPVALIDSAPNLLNVTLSKYIPLPENLPFNIPALFQVRLPYVISQLFASYVNEVSVNIALVETSA